MKVKPVKNKIYIRTGFILVAVGLTGLFHLVSQAKLRETNATATFVRALASGVLEYNERLRPAARGFLSQAGLKHSTKFSA